MSRYDNCGQIYCAATGREMPGFLSPADIPRGGRLTVVPPGMEYRPDKIAAYFLGDARAGWRILAANGCGIEDLHMLAPLRIPL